MPYKTSGMGNPFGFTLTPWVKRLLIANGVAFIFTLAFGGLVPYLAFTPAQVLTQPWTLLTYMFVHGGFFHLFFNMLALFFFGPPLEERWGSREFLKFYLICGLGAALLSILFPYQSIIGASGAVFGLLVAYAIYWPDNPIYIWGIFPVKAKWLVTFFIAINLFYAISGGSGNIAYLAHLGGAAAAFLYLKSAWAPSPWGPRPARRPGRPGPRNQSPASPGPNWRTKLRSAKHAAEQKASIPPNTEEREVLDEVDRILDKISERGLGSLTEEERRRLDEVSRQRRTN